MQDAIPHASTSPDQHVGSEASAHFPDPGSGGLFVGATENPGGQPRADHVVTVERLADDWTITYRAMCLCGYTSSAHPKRTPATRAGNAHVKSHAPKRLAIWQAAPCPSWCIVEHHDWEPGGQGGRRHLSEWQTLDRPTLNAVLTKSGRWRARRTGIRLEQFAVHARDVWVHICTETGDGVFIPADGSDPLGNILIQPDLALDLAELIRQAACAAINETLGGAQ